MSNAKFEWRRNTLLCNGRRVADVWRDTNFDIWGWTIYGAGPRHKNPRGSAKPGSPEWSRDAAIRRVSRYFRLVGAA